MTTPLTSASARVTRTVRWARAEALRVGRISLAALMVFLAVAQTLPVQAAAAGLPTGLPNLAAVAAPQTPGPLVIDYPGGFNFSTPSRLKAAGVGIVIRYVAANAWKCLTPKEARALRGEGIDIAVVYETNATWMLGGRAAGVAAAKKARAAVIGCGGPKKPFVYFACDAATSRYSTVNSCLAGAASVLGADHVGIYGSYNVCASALKSGHATKAWQTEAWSSGKMLAQAVLYQPAHRSFGSLGLDYDSNYARADDIGQWGYSAPGSVGWTPASSSPTSATLNSVDFVGSSAGWAVGEAGAVIHTGDAGASWTPQSSPTTVTLNSVRLGDGATGWAVGDGGTVMRTTDAGASWALQSSPTTAALRSVDLADASTGWAVGDGGTVIHTTDGGETWAAQSTPTTLPLNAVDFVGSADGWAVGAAGKVLHTADGGTTWNSEAAPTTAALTGVHFADAETGWAVGSSGAVIHTVNGGKTWTAQSAPTRATLTSVDFVDEANGWAVGEGGRVAHTTNGGLTWTAQSAPSTATLNAVRLTGPGAGCAVGGAGTVLRASGAGTSPFGTIVGVLTDAVTGAPIAGASVSVGSQIAAPTAPDGSFVAARVRPGTYGVTFSNARYITHSKTSVVVSPGVRAVVKDKLTPRAVTALTPPSFEPTAPVGGQTTSLIATLNPGSAVGSAVSVMSGSHWEQKSVKKRVKGKVRWVKVWYWRYRFSYKMTAGAAGRVVVRTVLARGLWRVQATYPGSGRFLPSASATTRLTVR